MESSAENSNSSAATSGASSSNSSCGVVSADVPLGLPEDVEASRSGRSSNRHSSSGAMYDSHELSSKNRKHGVSSKEFHGHHGTSNSKGNNNGAIGSLNNGTGSLANNGMNSSGLNNLAANAMGQTASMVQHGGATSSSTTPQHTPQQMLYCSVPGPGGRGMYAYPFAGHAFANTIKNTSMNVVE